MTRLSYKILKEIDPSSPRENSNLGTMVCFHKKYTLGDEVDITQDQFGSWDELKEYLMQSHNKKGLACILPLYLYDHSGLRISTWPFNDIWDSGQVGFIYVTRSMARKEYGPLSDAILAEIKQVLETEVEIYNQYLSGDVWGYVIEDSLGKRLDSCWGFYGYSDCESQAKEALQSAFVNMNREVVNL